MYDREGLCAVTYTTDEDHISGSVDIIVDALKGLTFAEATIIRGLQNKVDEMLEDRS